VISSACGRRGVQLNDVARAAPQVPSMRPQLTHGRLYRPAGCLAWASAIQPSIWTTPYPPCLNFKTGTWLLWAFTQGNE
jgi:hypothetical protein